MRLEDVSQQNGLATTPPADAAKNINNSVMFNLPPDQYKEQAKQLNPTIDSLLSVNLATPYVAGQIKQSEQHASMIKPVVENLSYMERLWGHASEKISQRTGPVRELTDLRWRMLDQPQTLTEDDKFRLSQLSAEEQDNFGEKNYGITGFWESIPGEVAGEIANLSGIAKRNKEVFGLAVGGGAALGAVRGAPGALPGLLIGAGTGAFTGAVTGYQVASTLDAFRDTAAQTYSEVLKATDENGKPINLGDGEARALAYGTGAVSAAIEFVADAAVLRTVPAFKKFFGGKATTELIKNPALRKTMNVIGAGLMEGGTEVAQEFVQILTEDLAGTFDGGNDEFRLVNALERTADRIAKDPKVQERLTKSFVVGGTMGSGFSAAGQVANPAIEKVLSSRDSKSIPINKTVEQKAVQGAAMEDALNFSVATLNSPKFNQMPKENKVKLLSGMMEQYGVEGKVWVGGKFNEWFGDNPERMARVQQVLDRNNLTPDAPLEFTTQEFADLVLDYPDVAEWAQIQADAMNGRGAREFVEQNKAYEQRKRELQSKYDLGEKDPEQRAYKIKVTNGTSDADLAKALDSRETAEAFLNRLDVEEQVVIEEGEGRPLNSVRLMQLNDIAALRERVKIMAPELPDHQSVQDTLKRSLDEEPDLAKIISLRDYIDRPTFTEAVEGVISEAEVKKINEASTSARQQTADAILDAAVYEMNQVRDEVEDQATEVQYEIEAAAILNDPNVRVVDQFHSEDPQIYPTARFRDVNDMTSAHVKEGYSPFAIDPRTLTDAQRKKFSDNKLLKKHKAFVKGGLTPDDAAALLGVNGGDNLLNILSTTPTRKDLIEQNVKRREKEIEDIAIDSVPLNETAIVKAANNKTANHISEMKYLVSEKWSATKRTIKRITKPLPKIEVLQARAAEAIQQTKIKDLSPNKYKVGERRAQNRATDAVLAGDLELAFDAKEQAALNSALTIESQKAVASVNRLRKFARRLTKPENVRTLKAAGMLDAANELLDVYNLLASKKGDSKRGSYVKYVDKQLAAGQGNFEIPEKFYKTIADPRSTFGDMTVEEANFVHTRLKQLLKMAERKNELNLEFGDPAKELQTFDNMARQLIEQAESHPDFDKSRNKNTFTDYVAEHVEWLNRVKSFWSSFKNIEHIVVNLDKNQTAGKYFEAILAPIKGDGKFGNMGDAGKTRDWAILRKHIKENIVDFFGEAEWKKMATNRFAAPEFKNANGVDFNNDDGTVSEATLFMMLLNDGNDSNAQRLTNYGVDIETIRKVYRRHLTEKHGIAAQRIFDTYKSYFPRVQALQERTTGESVEFIQGRAFQVGGKVFPGGYYPVTYQSMMSHKEVRSKMDAARKQQEGKIQSNMRDYYYADDMTRHGFTESRENTVTDRLVNLNMSTIGTGFDAILHDLNFREPVAQALKVVGDKDIAANIIAVIGKQDYNALFNNIVDAAASQSMENDALFSSQEAFSYFAARVKQGAAVSYLVGNAASIGIQPTSIAYAFERMGLSALGHATEITEAIARDPEIIWSMFKTASEINPSIRAAIENIDENTRNQLEDLIPKNYRNDATKFLSQLQDNVNKLGFGAFAFVDIISKTIVTNTAYKQFLAGDVKGYDLDTLKGMKKEDVRQKAIEYANSISRQTLTSGARSDRAGIQKDKWMQLEVAFWNDARNVLNNTTRIVRQTKWDIKGNNYFAASQGVLTLMLLSGVARVFMDVVRGNPLPFWDEDEKEIDLAETAWYFTSAPADITLGNIPVVRNAYYYAKTRDWNKAGVQSLGAQAINQVSRAAFVGLDWVNAVIADEDFELSEKNAKDIGFTLSYLTGGIPINMLMNIFKNLESKPNNDVFAVPVTEELTNALDDLQARKDAGAVDIPDDVWQQIQNIKNEANPNREPQSIPAETEETIEKVVSDGKWYKKNEVNGATGIYQFTEQTWKDIMDRAPELGLTKGGRVASDGEEQREAMKWYTQSNNEALTRAGIESTTANLLGAHMLGAEAAVKVLNSNGSEKLKTLVDESTLEANQLKKSMKVKEFKLWLDNKVASAKTTS